jgi:hypothetical protein
MGPKAKTYIEATRALFTRFGHIQTADRPTDYGIDNNAPLMARNAADTADVEMLRVDSGNKVRLAGAALNPNYQTVSFHLATNSLQASQIIWIVPQAYAGAEVVGINYIHATKAGSACAASIVKCADGVAIASGTSLMSGTFDADGANNTMQSATVSTTKNADGTPVVRLAYKDRIGIKFSAAVAALAGVVVTVTLSVGNKGEMAMLRINANGEIADQSFIIAPCPLAISEILYCHSTKGTNGGAVNVQVTRETGTTAPGAGTDLLTNNTNAGFDCKGANDTVQVGTFNATTVQGGSRLSADFAGVTTALAGVVIVVVFAPIQDMKIVTYTNATNANIVDESFFLADRAYQIAAAAWKHATAAGGAQNVQLVRDDGTGAPGSGTNLLTNGTNAGFDINAVADTVEFATFAAGTPYLVAGDRLSVDYSAVASTAGAICTVLLWPM